MSESQSNTFVSVVLLSFPSKVQYDLWYEKYITFYSTKAVEFLKDNGQISQSANLVDDDNDLIRVSLIWIYQDIKAYEACQKFHGQWAKIGGEYIGKSSGYRGEQIWGFN
jgi:hypothetical protein